MHCGTVTLLRVSTAWYANTRYDETIFVECLLYAVVAGTNNDVLVELTRTRSFASLLFSASQPHIIIKKNIIIISFGVTARERKARIVTRLLLPISMPYAVHTFRTRTGAPSPNYYVLKFFAISPTFPYWENVNNEHIDPRKFCQEFSAETLTEETNF